MILMKASKDAQIESKKLEPKLKELGTDKIRQELKESEERIKKLGAEATSEEAKANYIKLLRCFRWLMLVMLLRCFPYNQALATAQTAEARASAALWCSCCLSARFLIDSGYINSLARDIAAKAGISENEEILSDIATALRTGKYDDLEEKGIMKVLWFLA